MIPFRDKKSFDYFLEHGWDSGVQSDATIKSGKKGGSVVDVVAAANYEKIKVYNLTASGIAPQATLQGYKYWQGWRAQYSQTCSGCQRQITFPAGHSGASHTAINLKLNRAKHP